MQVLVNRNGRRIKLTRRERDLLTNAKALLAELGTLAVHDDAELAADAAENIGAVLDSLSLEGKEQPA